VLLDHREQIAEQRALLLAQLLGERVGAWGPAATLALADAGVAATLLLGRVGLAQLACALVWRNRSPSSCLARQAA
jgi:hypothetical protein